MRNKLLYLLVAIPIFLLTSSAFAQTTLQPGEVMITGYYGDGDSNCNEGFSFVSFVDLAPGTVIRFSEEDFSDFSAGLEGDIAWTNTSGSTISSLTNIVLTTHSQSSTTCAATAASVGSFVFEGAGTWSLGTTNEEIIVFQGPSVRNITTAISIFLTDNGASASNYPPSLFGSSFVIDFTVVDPDVDVAVYTGPITFSNFNDFVAQLTDLTTNWATEDGPGNNGANGTGVEFPASTPVFNPVCNEPDVPSLSVTPTTVCTGSGATINISGNLNDATQWNIYTGSCGGTLIGSTTTTSFSVISVNAATTYFVRGEEGCVTPASCGSVTITPTPVDDASFNYSSASYCTTASFTSPNITGTSGGTFSSTPFGLSINPSNGTLNPDFSFPGTYSVTYTTAGSCPSSSSVSVTINDIDDASFSYSAATYSKIDSNPTPTITGLSGGTFSSTAGLSLNTSTGEINILASTEGAYTVTYTTAGSCPNSATQSVTITSNDDLAGATSLTYGAGCTGSIYDIAGSTLESGETVPECAFDEGVAVVPADRSSQWFSFVASSTGDALIKITDDGSGSPQSPSIALTLSLFNAPTTPGDVSTLGAPIVCSSISTFPIGEILDGTFIDAKGLTPGNSYFIQVYSNSNNTINYCIDVTEPIIYTYNGSWSPSNPELVNNPYKRVEVLSGDAFQAASTMGPIFDYTIGSLYVAANASITYDALLVNQVLEVDGVLNPISNPNSLNSLVIIFSQASNAVRGTGKANAANMAFLTQNRNETPMNVDLVIDIYRAFNGGNEPINFLKDLTFKSNAEATAIYDPREISTDTSLSNASITGNVIVEQYIPESPSANGRAFRFVSSPVTTVNSIFSNWQENGANPVGYGTHITGTAGTVGVVDGATGFDQTTLGNSSLFTYSDNTSQSWNALTSTNQVGDSLKIAKGYRLFVRGDRNLDLLDGTSSGTTTLRSKGNLQHKSISNSYDVDAGEFIFTGNPYQNAVEINDLLAASTNVENDVVYYWDPTLGGLNSSGGAYVTYSYDLSGVGTPSTPTANNGFIQPGQAVFVEASAGANGANNAVISYNPSQLDSNGIVTGASNTVTSTPTSAPASISMSLFDTNSFNGGHTASDGILIRFDSNYSNNVGTGDHTKFMNIDESVAIEQLGNNYAVAGRSMPIDNEIIQLNHYNYGNADYTYVINVEGLSLLETYVVDQFTNTLTTLVDGLNTYNFTVDTSNPASVAIDRFQLKFGNVTLGTGDAIEGNDFAIYPNPSGKGEIVNIISSQFRGVDVDLRITDLSGKLILSSVAQFDAQGKYQLKESNLKTGLYIVELSDNLGHNVVRKLVID